MMWRAELSFHGNIQIEDSRKKTKKPSDRPGEAAKARLQTSITAGQKDSRAALFSSAFADGTNLARSNCID
jgi:hypothetical protein